MAKEKINALVDGGKATAGPPLGPKLGPLGINVGQLINDINEATKNFEGIKVPVEVIIDTEKKDWKINVGSPPTSQLLFKEINISKGSGMAWSDGTNEEGEALEGEPIVGDVSKEVIIKVAKIKHEEMGTRTLKNAVKNVVGTCVSAGLTIEEKHPREAQKEIDEGKWDEYIKE